MKQSFTVPVAYQRYVVAELALICDAVGRDALYRAENDEIAAWANVPDHLVDKDARGTAMITITDEKTP